MHCRHKDGLSGDAVHVDAGASLQVIEVHVAKLGDQVDDVVLGAHLGGGGGILHRLSTDK